MDGCGGGGVACCVGGEMGLGAAAAAGVFFLSTVCLVAAVRVVEGLLVVMVGTVVLF